MTGAAPGIRTVIVHRLSIPPRGPLMSASCTTVDRIRSAKRESPKARQRLRVLLVTPLLALFISLHLRLLLQAQPQEPIIAWVSVGIILSMGFMWELFGRPTWEGTHARFLFYQTPSRCINHAPAAMWSIVVGSEWGAWNWLIYTLAYLLAVLDGCWVHALTGLRVGGSTEVSEARRAASDERMRTNRQRTSSSAASGTWRKT